MRHFVLSVLSFVVMASPAFAQRPRGFVDVDFVGVRSAQDEQTYTLSGVLFREPASVTTAYPQLPTAKGIQITGGFEIASGFGVGARFTPVNYKYTVGLGATIPHPTLFNRSDTDTSVTDSTLARTDRAFDVSVIYFAPMRAPWQVRLFGGPTFFRVEQEMVSDISYTQLFNLLGANNVTITGFDSSKVDGSAVGFHVGADVSHFFNDHLGVGGTFGFSKGTVDIDEEPLTEDATQLKVGQTVFGAGLRLRF